MRLRLIAGAVVVILIAAAVIVKAWAPQELRLIYVKALAAADINLGSTPRKVRGDRLAMLGEDAVNKGECARAFGYFRRAADIYFGDPLVRHEHLAVAQQMMPIMIGGACAETFVQGEGRDLLFRVGRTVKATFLDFEERSWSYLASAFAIPAQRDPAPESVRLASDTMKEYLALKRLRGFQDENEMISAMTQAMYVFQMVGDSESEAAIRDEMRTVLMGRSRGSAVGAK